MFSIVATAIDVSAHQPERDNVEDQRHDHQTHAVQPKGVLGGTIGGLLQYLQSRLHARMLIVDRTICGWSKKRGV